MAIRSLTPREVADLGRDSASPVIFLDVREPWEVERVCLPHCLHLPMGEIKERLAELRPEQSYVVMCHHGHRSLQVAAFLHAQGFRDIINLLGVLMTGPSMWTRASGVIERPRGSLRIPADRSRILAPSPCML